jgi:hypothetical protein
VLLSDVDGPLVPRPSGQPCAVERDEEQMALPYVCEVDGMPIGGGRRGPVTETIQRAFFDATPPIFSPGSGSA